LASDYKKRVEAAYLADEIRKGRLVFTGRSGLEALFSDPDPEKYLHTMLLYFDDLTFDTHNSWCGELMAVNEPQCGPAQP